MASDWWLVQDREKTRRPGVWGLPRHVARAAAGRHTPTFTSGRCRPAQLARKWAIGPRGWPLTRSAAERRAGVGLSESKDNITDTAKSIGKSRPEAVGPFRIGENRRRLRRTEQAKS